MVVFRLVHNYFQRTNKWIDLKNEINQRGEFIIEWGKKWDASAFIDFVFFDDFILNGFSFEIFMMIRANTIPQCNLWTVVVSMNIQPIISALVSG
jgi:hypothetical protein